jgi:acyl carrier protein
LRTHKGKIQKAMEATYNEIRKILSKNFFINPRAISEAKKFKNDLGLNSVEFLEMVYDIESTFGINIPDEQLEKVRTVKDMARCVEMQRVAVLV